MVDTVRLGNLLRLQRKSHAFTQSFVADITDISERALRYIESGNAEPELDTYWMLCDLYQMPPDYGYLFYHRSPEMENNLEILKPELTPVE